MLLEFHVHAICYLEMKSTDGMKSTGKMDRPNGFKNYVSFYEEIYEEVKNISPDTKVFCIFAGEIITESREANLDVLNLFNSNKMDLLVFTSYLYALEKTNPPMIPDD